ncbi:GIY-YIG nuclease family protein [Phormidesmis sp. 146-33]
MSLQAEARNILENLSSMPFEECYPLSRGFLDVPTCPGLYAIRHQEQGILYIGQTAKLRQRFKDGHKAFFWAFLEYCTPDEIKIAIERLGFQSLQRAEDLEILMIRMAKPRYNTRIK